MGTGTTNAGSSKVVNYSTTEHKTGRKWIDGKPIYEITVDTGSLANINQLAGHQKIIPHSVSNISKIIHYEGMALDANNTMAISLPYVSIASTSSQIQLEVNGTNIYITSLGDWLGLLSSYVTIEYTKTTD